MDVTVLQEMMTMLQEFTGVWRRSNSNVVIFGCLFWYPIASYCPDSPVDSDSEQ